MSVAKECFNAFVPAHHVSIEIEPQDDQGPVVAKVFVLDKVAKPSPPNTHDIDLKKPREITFSAQSQDDVLDQCRKWIEENFGSCGRFIATPCT